MNFQTISQKLETASSDTDPKIILGLDKNPLEILEIIRNFNEIVAVIHPDRNPDAIEEAIHLTNLVTNARNKLMENWLHTENIATRMAFLKNMLPGQHETIANVMHFAISSNNIELVRALKNLVDSIDSKILFVYCDKFAVVSNFPQDCKWSFDNIYAMFSELLEWGNNSNGMSNALRNTLLLYYTVRLSSLDYSEIVEIIRLLINSGADLNYINQSSQNPLEYLIKIRANKKCIDAMSEVQLETIRDFIQC